MIRLRLSDDERTELNTRLGDRKITVDARARLDMVRLSDAGHSAPAIARWVGRHENTVRKLLRRFQEERLAALPKRVSPGRPPRLSGEHLQALEAMLDGAARAFTSAQMAAWAQEQFGLSIHPRHLTQRLKRRGWRYKRTKSSLAHKEPAAAAVDAKREALAALKKEGGAGGA